MPFAQNSRATVLAVLCSAALALGVASCGGKSGASGSGTKATAPARTGQVGSATGTSTAAQATVSSKQFIARVDRICARANAALARSEANAKGKLRKPDTHAAVIARNQEIEEKAIKSLAEPKPPAALAGAWKKMSLYRGALARQLGVLATATRLRVANVSQLAASKKKLHAQLHDVGSKAGFKDCAKVG